MYQQYSGSHVGAGAIIPGEKSTSVPCRDATDAKFRSHPLVPVTNHTHDVLLDLTYATPHNVAGRVIYERPICLIHRDADACLRLAVQHAAKAGCRELDMGTAFDDMTSLSHHFCDRVSPQAQTNRMLLLHIMESAGFKHIPHEWWHYALPERDAYPLISSAALGALNPMLAATS